MVRGRERGKPLLDCAPLGFGRARVAIRMELAGQLAKCPRHVGKTRILVETEKSERLGAPSVERRAARRSVRGLVAASPRSKRAVPKPRTAVQVFARGQRRRGGFRLRAGDVGRDEGGFEQEQSVQPGPQRLSQSGYYAIL